MAKRSKARRAKSSRSKKEKSKIKYAPLKGTVFGISIIGFLTAIYLFDRLGPTWGITLGLFFLILFIASLISLIRGPISAQTER